MSLIWLHTPTAQWLVVDNIQTHTKTRAEFSYVRDIESASTLSSLPFELRGKRGDFIPYEIKVTRTVEMIGKLKGQDESD